VAAARVLIGVSWDARYAAGEMAKTSWAALGMVVALTVSCATSEPERQTSALPTGGEHVELDPSEFTTDIDNPWWPMAVGSRWVYKETDDEGANQRVEVTVTDKTKKLANGVVARVVRDEVTEDGEPVEITDDFYAQDADGNIWYLGEETTEYEDGEAVSTEGSFEAGKDGAEAGIIMPADPRPGMTYRQEYYEGEAEDRGEIVALDAKAKVPYGSFENVLKTKDTNPLEPDVVEYKYYAKDIGLVLAETVEGGSDREELITFDNG
jgi:hypothetical protein